MNKKFICSTLAVLALLACQKYDKYDVYVPSEYSDILSLKQTGSQDVDLYSGIGEDGTYSLTILKGGISPSETSKATLRALTDQELDEMGSEYRALPDNLYEIQTPSLTLATDVRYSKGLVAFKTDEIKTFLEQHTDKKYTLPLILESATDSVNVKHRTIFLVPQVKQPVIAFAGTLSPLVAITSQEQSKEYKLRLELPFESPWDFEATIAVDEEALSAGLTKLTAEDYTLSDAGRVLIKKGERLSTELTVNLKNSGTYLGSDFRLPLKIASTSKQGIVAQGKLQMSLSYNKVPLVGSMLSTNAQEPSEGPIANLVDGAINTYFHTRWSGTQIDLPHWIQMNLPEPASRFKFVYWTRNPNNGNGVPQAITLQGSNDGNTWTDIQAINTGLPTGSGQKYISSELGNGTAYSQLRLQITQTSQNQKYSHMAELELYAK